MRRLDAVVIKTAGYGSAQKQSSSISHKRGPVEHDGPLSISTSSALRSRGPDGGKLAQGLRDRIPGTVPTPAISALMARLGVSVDTLHIAIVSTLLELGHPLDPGLIERLARKALASGKGKDAHHQSNEGAAGRLTVLAWDKGLILSEDAVSSLLGDGGDSMADGSSSDAGPGEGNQRGNGSKDNAPGDSTPHPSSPQPTPSMVQELIKEGLACFVAGAGCLSLFDGLPGKDGRRWLRVPFTFPDGPLQCELRILCVPEAGDRYRAERMELDVRSSMRAYRFAFRGPGLSFAVVATDPSLPAHPLQKAWGEAFGPTAHLATALHLDPYANFSSSSPAPVDEEA